MGSKSHQNASSRSGLKATVGEIVEVQGGHIVRSTGRKDRHSKVCTAKGPRDRRVRLAAYTAIQFYDVQDRLGYDRPSKAVDWLIKKAKAAIDELAELPPWHPTSSSAPNKTLNSENAQQKPEVETQQDDLVISNVSNEFADNNSNPQNSSFFPASMDSDDAIADSMKSFFPTGGSGGASSSAMQQFQSFPTQDLRLSLHSFQDPVLLHQDPSPANSQTLQGQVLLSATPLGFDGWPEQNQHHHHQALELSRFQRLTPWNFTGDAAAGNGGGATSAGFLFNSPPAPQPLLQQLLGHNQFFSQRGPLQSSNSSSTRAWMDPPTPDHTQSHHQIYPSSVSTIGFAPEFGGFSGFRIPARIQGEEEEHDGYSDKPSSASSDSRH